VYIIETVLFYCVQLSICVS